MPPAPLGCRPLLLLLLTATACTPTIAPPWLLDGPRELALDVEVTEQGPYGARIDPGPRTFRDALPLDTLTLRPVVVDPDGPVPADSLEGVWMLCSGVGNCLLRERVQDRPACDPSELQPSEPCVFDDQSPAQLTIANIPEALPSDTSTVLSIISGPTVAYLASPPGGPGLQACLERFDARERLDGCLMMERALGLGPLGDLVDALEAVGIDPGIEPTAQTLLDRPRNRNPAVERVRVEYGQESLEVDAGERVVVPRGQDVRLAVLTTDADLDGYEILLGTERVLLTDDLGAEWWFDQQIDLEDPLPGSLDVRLRSGTAAGLVRAYVVLRDNLGGEGWGFVDLDFGG